MGPPHPLVRRLLRVHDLPAADALQLAAALAASEQSPESLEVVCLDTRLAAAAPQVRPGSRVTSLTALRRARRIVLHDIQCQGIKHEEVERHTQAGR